MQFSFRQILPLSFSLNILFVVGIITLLTRWQGERVVQEVAQQWHQEMGRHIETRLQTYLSQAEILNQSQQSLLKHELVSARDLPKIEAFLREQLQANPYLPYTAWANTKGDYIGISRTSKQELQIETSGEATNWQYRTYSFNLPNKQRKLIRTFSFYDPRNRPWYQTAIKSKKSAWSSIYLWFDRSQLALDAVLPIYNLQGQLLGVADTPLPLQHFSQFLSQLSESRPGQSFIVDQAGQLIANSSNQPLFKNDQGSFQRLKATDSNDFLIRQTSRYFQKHFNSTENPQNIPGFTIFDGNQRHFVQVIPFTYGENINWFIYLVIPESNFITPLKTANQITLVVTVIALTIAIFMSMAIARWIYQPILDIYEASLEIASGNWHKKVAVSSSYELARLGAAFNQMADELKMAFESLEFKALHGDLTYLPNRLFLNQHLSQLVEEQKKDSQVNYAILFLDLDDFKIINDSLGHLMGDELLKQVAHRLRTSVHPQNFLARFGGDEFVIVLSPILNQQAVLDYVERLLRHFDYPFFLEDRPVSIKVSIGVTFSSMGYEHPQDILRDASIAMSEAKRKGKNCYQVMTTALQRPAIERLQVITELKQALKKQEFRLYFQPIITLENKQLAGFETLIRWQHPLHGLVSPNYFIAIAEESGLIREIDLWVLEAVCEQLKEWQEKFKMTVPLMLSLNFSPVAFRQMDTFERIKHVLKDVNLEPWQLKLEITETQFVDTLGQQGELLDNLQDLDLEFCLDDFGTGHSSLSRLQQLPIHTLKIDRSFVLQIESEKTGIAVIKTIINLAHDLGMSVVVEGIETQAQETIVRRLGCDYAQGFYFSEPLPVSQTTELLSQFFSLRKT